MKISLVSEFIYLNYRQVFVTWFQFMVLSLINGQPADVFLLFSDSYQTMKVYNEPAKGNWHVFC